MLHWRSCALPCQRLLLGLSRSQSTKSGREPQVSENMSISPLDLTENHVSQMYGISNDDMKTAFSTSLPRHFAAEVSALGHACWLLRRQSYEIVQELREYNATQPQEYRYLLYGRDGSGKTLCMHQILHYCIRAGWMVIFIPGVFSWTHSAKGLRPSAQQPGTFDQPEAATAWLKTFRNLNSNFTAQLCLSRDWVWGKKDHSPAGEEVNKVIEKGLVKPVLATEVVAALLQELVLASDRFKMILAVDEFNGCFNPTSLMNPQKDWLLPQQLNLVRNLLQLIPQFPGPVLLALSRTRMLRCPATDWSPNDLLSEGAAVAESRAESQAILESCRAVEVPPYTRQEMETSLDYYSNQSWVNTELSPAVVNEIWHLTTGNPFTLHKMCASL